MGFTPPPRPMAKQRTRELCPYFRAALDEMLREGLIDLDDWHKLKARWGMTSNAKYKQRQRAKHRAAGGCILCGAARGRCANGQLSVSRCDRHLGVARRDVTARNRARYPLRNRLVSP